MARRDDSSGRIAMISMTRRAMGMSAFAVVFAASMAAAQAPQVVRVRATIEAVDGHLLTVKTRDGAMMKIKLADNAPASEVVRASLSGVKVGSYIAVTATPEPDGSQKATAVFIFPPGPHVGEGFHPWDFTANSTMTNATVANEVAAASGQTLTVKYKGGEKTIIVPPSAEIATAKKASIADLKAGQRIFIFAAKRLPDGTFTAANVSFGDYGVWR
jgi:hypothetical protein